MRARGVQHVESFERRMVDRKGDPAESRIGHVSAKNIHFDSTPTFDQMENNNQAWNVIEELRKIAAFQESLSLCRS